MDHGKTARRVTLTGKWYVEAIGAMLGNLQDGTPIAIIPHGIEGYYYVEPLTGRHVAITSANADSIRSEALCLYRPLPLKPLGLRDMALFAVRALGPADYFMVVLVSVIATAMFMAVAWLT